MSPSDALENFDILKKDIQRLVKSLEGIQSIKPNDPLFLSKLEKFGQKFPAGDDLKQTADDIRQRLNQYVLDSRNQRISDFTQNFNKFMKQVQDQGKNHRITDNTKIRVEELEFQADPKNGYINVLFNKIVLIPWREVSSADDIWLTYDEASTTLRKSSIPENILPEIVVMAYSSIRSKQEYEKKLNAHLVPVSALHEEMIIGLLRNQMKGKSALSKKFKDIYLPDWAFRYNLDRYRSLLPTLPEDKKVVFQTGSQLETERNGVVLNGLNAQEEYKKFCYVMGSVR